MKKLSLSIMLMIFGFGLFASSVSLQSAQTIAEKFYKHYAINKTNSTVANVITEQKDGTPTFYIFTFSEGGFVMVSADDAALPIIGYSADEIFDQNNIPANAQAWFDQRSAEIKSIIDDGLTNAQTLPEWNKITNNQLPSTKSAVAPMTTTVWDQSSPFNNLCPSGTYTGCVATAMAQVMKFWNYPTTGTGSHTYTPPGYSAQTANFGNTTYLWANMIDNYLFGGTSAQNSAVATLMFHCGVSVDMAYGTSGSGAYTFNVPPALINHFNYSPSAEDQFMANFTAADWLALLKNELDNGRPVIYAGDDGSAGHCFVADGYNSSNQFHFNWGWSGSSNGYFTIGSLNPSGESFNLDNNAIVRITPPLGQPVADFTASTITPAVGGPVQFTDASTNNPTSWTWSFPGGNPSTATGQVPPTVTYAAAGYHSVSLTVSNGVGSDSKTRTQYIDVGGTPSAWIQQNSAFATASRGINCISIVNPYVVWAGAVDGASTTNYIQDYTKTVNGGASWTPGTITFTGSTTCGIANLYAFNDTVCYAAMFPGSASTGGYVAKTTNGGTTWSIANSPSFSSSWLDFVYFFDPSNGVCVGDPSGSDYVIYTTSNGGTSWTVVAASTLPNCTSTETAITNQFDAVGNSIWFGTTKGRIYKSTDKGLTWTVTTTGLGTSAAVTPVFKDANTGIVIGSNSSTGAYIGIRKTTDGGATWTALTPTGFFVKTPNIDYVPGTTSMWVDGASATGNGSSYSMDDCSTFLDIDTTSTVQYTCIKFYDVNTGWAGSFNTSATVGGIYKWKPLAITNINPVKNNSEQVNVYPNPSTNLVNVEFAGFTSEKATITVYNLVGERILAKDVNPSYNGVEHLDFSANEPGIYIVTIASGNNVITKRVSIIR